MKNTIQLFEKQQVRTVWDEKAEKWWFSVLDIITILTDQPDYKKTRNYRKWLKSKLKEEGSEVVSVTNHLKLLAPDGKMRLTDEWKKYGLKEGLEFATLTDIIYKTWAGKTAKEYKKFKDLKKENLRDNMTNLELVLNMLAEASTT